MQARHAAAKDSQTALLTQASAVAMAVHVTRNVVAAVGREGFAA